MSSSGGNGNMEEKKFTRGIKCGNTCRNRGNVFECEKNVFRPFSHLIAFSEMTTNHHVHLIHPSTKHHQCVSCCRDRACQRLQQLRKRRRVREESFLADLPPDCFLRDDDQSSSSSDPSLHSDQSTGKIIDFKKSDKSNPDRDQRWQRLQQLRERRRVREECFLADLPPDCFLRDDDQSSSSSDPSLHSDQSTGKKIDLKKIEKSHPIKDRACQRLQQLRKRRRVREESFLADLPPDCFLRDDDQSSSSSDPSLHSDQSTGKIIDFKKSDKSNPDRDQRWQRLQQLRERRRVREECFLADLPPDCFLRDDDQSSSSSDPSLHSDQSTGKIIDFKKSDKSNPARDQRWQRLQQLRERRRVREECFLADLPPDCFLRDDDQSSSSSDPSLHSDQSTGKKIDLKKIEKSHPIKDRACQRLQQLRKRRRVREESFLADLPPDCFLRDDDQSSSSSDPSLHSDQSTGKIIDFKKSDKSNPDRDQIRQRLQELREQLRVQKESFLADLPPHHFLSDDAQSSRPSDPSFTTRDDAQSSRPSDPSLTTLDQIRQRLQQLREQLRVREERFLARLPPDLDDDQSSRPSDPSLHSDQSKEKMIDLKKIEIDYPAWDQSLLPEREDF
ncbi:uncharacterized protein [Labrus bergylta]|uniref:uncharacterized protein n=1 Tax=Labrus bergylta TaxID=56723 RepID=UPI0033141812